MRNDLYIILAVLVLVLFNTSCISPRKTLTYQYPRGHRPELWVVYHPYPNLKGLPGDLRPVPMYEGWTDERMLRDLKRIQFAGFKGILLSIRPQDIAREHIRSRCRQFYKLAHQVSPDFRVGLLFTAGSGNTLSMPLQNVMNFFQHQHFGEFPNAIRLQNLPVLFLDSNLSASGTYSGRYAYRRIGKELPERSIWGKVPAPKNADGFTWVTAASNGGLKFNKPGLFQQWSIPRDNGRQLFNGIQLAVNQQASIICVHSWNNYEDGSFIEENTYDSASMMWTMRHIHEDLNNPQPVSAQK